MFSELIETQECVRNDLCLFLDWLFLCGAFVFFSKRFEANLFNCWRNITVSEVRCKKDTLLFSCNFVADFVLPSSY